MDYLSREWCGLQWTEWIPFSNNNLLSQLPAKPGLYKIRPVGSDFLVYIGQTGRSLKERMKSHLRGYLKSDTEMPFNDPHTAAPSLWAWRDAEGWDFECSVAVLEFPALEKEQGKQMREGVESYLLWKYRLERGESTHCNFGRFHPDYVKSASRKSGKRGGRLPKGVKNPAWGMSFPPADVFGNPTDEDWMHEVWSVPQRLIPNEITVGNIPGCYKIIVDEDVVYIGQSSRLHARLMMHVGKKWGENPLYSVVCMSEDTPVYQLLERENDFIGGYVSQMKRPPKFQFLNLD